ncbi:MAG: Ferredoxin-6 [Proteobacteria bacterium]|nr:MAG: Ferredoxin-6 [Pseudomonadota bacterium]|tara:strand:+ start:382 stop:732 length:351 start_codon:yes stop_codon:yes gene_type:complete
MSDVLHVNYILPNGEKVVVEASEGDDLLTLAHRNKIALEGACEGSLACSTCHVIVDKSYFSKLEEAVDEEEDMLDYAFGLTATSRLGCQIKMCKKLDGITVTLPAQTRNMQLEKML